MRKFTADSIKESTRLWVCALGLLATGWPAWAGRPVSTDDASVNDRGTCQLEAWMERVHEVRHTHLAPACGVLDGLELGAEWDNPAPSHVEPLGMTASVKWAPESLAWRGWRFGAKTGFTSEKPPGDPERHFSRWMALAIASYPVDDRWTVHLNLGHARDKVQSESATAYGGALVYAMNDRAQAFAEWMGDSRTAATRAVGMRWWILPDTLGLDLTASQRNATPNCHAWGIGLGWYGLRF